MMSQEKLNRFLLDEAIKDDLNMISRLIATASLSNIERDPDISTNAKPIDWKLNLLAASILARGTTRETEEAALCIATGAITLSTDITVNDSGALILEKLANDRSLHLGYRKNLLKEGLLDRLGVSNRLQSTFRRVDNSILIDATGEFVAVNRFQQQFWAGAEDRATWLSASAPTASGKTYIVLRWLINRLLISGDQVAVYIAPTRALVSEVDDHLVLMIDEQNIANITVSSLPLDNRKGIKNKDKNKTVFVLTQERLHLLANVAGENFRVHTLIVDEAHKVGDRLRGVILQDAIERVVRLNPSVQVVFVSPATENPAALLSDAPEGTSSKSIDSDSPTVIQNVIFANQVPRKPTKWALTLQRGDTPLPLGILSLSARPTDLKKRLAFIAAAIAADGGTLVYTNGAAEAEEVAFLISQIDKSENTKRVTDPDLVALAQLIRKGVHSAYQLAPLVESRVAFHYGNMPSLIRAETERLFRIGKIKYLVCTSTLIEGVNLACKTIVVRGPRKGIGKPMQPHDFWNLAGRAGRWGAEFQGNIVCIDSNSTTAWPTGVPKRERYSIVRETDLILRSAEDLGSYISNRWAAPREEIGKSANSQFEQVSSYLLATFMRDGSIVNQPFVKRHSNATIEDINVKLSSLANNIFIPADLVSRHPGVNAAGMQRLLNSFAEEGSDIEKLLPAPPESDDAYKRLCNIMERINTHVYPAFFPDTLIPLHALVTNEWLRGLSLAAIIKARIKYHRKHGHDIDLPKLFRNTMALVEQTARFLAPKYVTAYIEVLEFYLKSIDRSDLIGDELNYGIMLEFGLSTKTLISLVELGLSRMSAVEIYEKIANDDLDQENVLIWLAEYGPRLEELGVPTLIIREVRERIKGLPPRDEAMEESFEE